MASLKESVVGPLKDFYMKIKYPRTFHLPFSESLTADDKRLKDCSIFQGKSVVVTEKMDVENNTMYCNAIHARSLDSRNHTSRSWVKQLHASICKDIPSGWRICGENLFAKHSIEYDELDSYFYVFSIWNENNDCLSWCDTIEYCSMLGLKIVPTIGKWSMFDEKENRGIKVDSSKSEGYVLRNDQSFHYSDFSKNVAKFVRSGHVQSDSHWMHSQVVKNCLKQS